VSGAEIDEERDEEGSPAPLTTDAAGGGTGGGEPERGHANRYRKPALAVARAIVVLAIAGAGYAVIIPTHHDRKTRVVDSRLAELAIPETGVTGFHTKPASASVQPAANAGISVMTTAAKHDPGHTGLYVKDWSGSAKGSTDAIGLVVFLLPTSDEAQAVLEQVSKMELAASAQSANSLDRTATFTVPGVGDSAGSVFEPKKPTKTSQDLAVSLFRQGTVVSFIQAAKTTTTTAGAAEARQSVISVSKAQADHVSGVEPGFSLVELVHPAGTSYPTTASIVWIAGSAIVAFLAAIGPIFYGRARRRREDRRQAELDRMIVVRGQTITKRRSGEGPRRR
jgi:hypothetical protein